MREKLTELLGKVERATGPDRDLDHAIWLALDPSEKKPGHVPLPWLCLYTSSIDAALALVERVLPVSQPGYQPGDYTWEIIRRFDGTCRCLFMRSSGAMQFRPMLAVDGASAPLAILGSLLKALLAQTEASDGR